MPNSHQGEPVKSFLIGPGVPVWADGVLGTVVEVLSSTEVMIREKGGTRYFKTHISHLLSLDDPRVEPPPEEPPSDPGDLSKIDQEALEVASRRYEVILPLLQGKGGKVFMEAHSKETETSIPTLYRWVRQYERGGQKLTTLLPKTSNRGPKGQNRLRPEIDELIWTHIHVELQKRKRRPRANKILRDIKSICSDLKLDPPSYTAVATRINQIPEFSLIQYTKGLKDAQRSFAIHKGHHPKVLAPLDELQIDHAFFSKITIVSEDGRLPVGHPWVTLAMDVYSRMCLGLYAHLDGPSAMAVGLCLVHAFSDKDDWLKKVCVNKSWPCSGKAKMVYADNGKDFHANSIKSACDQYGIVIQWRPIRQPHWGAHIERLFGTVKREIEVIDSKDAPSSLKSRADKSDGQTYLTMAEFETWLTLYFTGIYHVRKHRGIDAVPAQQWERGLLGGPDRPGRGLPPRIVDQARFLLDFLPYQDRKIHGFGVTLDCICYYDPVLRGLVQPRDTDDKITSKKFRFRRDPRDISVVYFFSEFDGTYISVPYRNITRPPASLFELKAAKRRLKELGKDKVNEDEIFQAIKEMRKLVETSKAKNRAARRFVERRKIHEKADPHRKYIEQAKSLDPVPPTVAPDPQWEELFSQEVRPYGASR